MMLMSWSGRLYTLQHGGGSGPTNFLGSVRLSLKALKSTLAEFVNSRDPERVGPQHIRITPKRYTLVDFQDGIAGRNIITSDIGMSAF